jgi:hypothetical protein
MDLTASPKPTQGACLMKSGSFRIQNIGYGHSTNRQAKVT